jgi:hypothetical protein
MGAQLSEIPIGITVHCPGRLLNSGGDGDNDLRRGRVRVLVDI